jgi:hypothetical protein
VRRLAVSQGDPLSAPAIVGDVLRSSGRPLDPSVRRFMEARFGYDFAGVRIHTDTQAAESAAAVGAQAYTYGNNIVFADGQYLPHSRSGRQLLAHELAHSIQQTQRGGQVTAVARLIQRQASAPGKTSTAGVRRGTTFVTRFHPGVAHNHKPTGRWADVQADAAKRCASASAELQKADPKKMPTLVETAGIECSCAHLPPSLVAKLARETVMLGLPLAQRHLDHYIDGSGSPLVEDLQAVLEQDTKLRAKLAAAMRRSKTGHIKIEQRDYGVKDFQYAFGAIDRLDFEVDSMSGQAHVWFQDRYEWHPVGFGYTSLPGDSRRDTNCVHAAMVELKSSGAQDYWMIGDAVVSLSAITPAPAGP